MKNTPVSQKINAETSSPYFGFSWPLIVGLLSSLGLLVLTSWHTSVDPDTYLHLTVGRWILDHWSIPRVDTYSHTLFGHAWVAHEWLSECILAAIYRFSGWTGLVLMLSLMLASTLAILLRFLLKRVPPIYAIFFTALVYSTLASHLLIRPHVLTWPLLVIWVGSLIDSSEKSQNPPLHLLVLMVLWANLHGSFVFGLAIVLPLGASAIWFAPQEARTKLLKGWLAFWVLAIGASILTPLGVDGLIFPFSLFKLSHLNSIIEWMPYQFSGLGGLEIALLSYFVLALVGLIKINLIDALVVAGLLHQALTHNRYASIFGLLTPMLIATSFGKQYQSTVTICQTEAPSKADLFFERLSGYASKKAIAIGMAMIFVVAFAASQFNRHEPSGVVFPKDAVEFAQSKGLSGPVLNAYEFGGYLISKGIPVFIDGRADLYDEEVLGPYLDGVRDGTPKILDVIVEKYKISWVLIRPDSPARSYFENSQRWKMLYEDKAAIIFTLQN